MNMLNDDAEERKSPIKDLALLAETTETSLSDVNMSQKEFQDLIALLSRNLNKYLENDSREERRYVSGSKKRRNQSRTSPKFEDGKGGQRKTKCYECKGIGHVAFECVNTRRRWEKKQKGFKAS